jgi:hypothetical protein
MIKSLPELEVIVDSIVILRNRAIINFNSAGNRYSIKRKQKDLSLTKNTRLLWIIKHHLLI